MTFVASSMMAMKVNAYDSSINLESEEVNIESSGLEEFSYIGEENSSSNDEIVLGLTQLYELYFSTLDSQTGDEKELTLAKMDKIKEFLDKYENKNMYLSNQNSSLENNSLNQNSIATYGSSPNCYCSLGVYCANCQLYDKLELEVCSIISGFTARGWFLAADLLMFNMTNKIVDVDYTPSSSLLVNLLNSEQICEYIAWNDSITGTYKAKSPGILNGSFNFENTEDGDVYNSLRWFHYCKNYVDDGKIQLSILDRYNWNQNEDGDVSGTLINTLYEAEKLGILTPFYTKIDIIIDGYVPLIWEYAGGYIKIIGGHPSLNSFTIPSSWYDFRQRQESLPTLNKVIISDSAFSNHKNLVSITIPDKVIHVGGNAFENCVCLEEVDISPLVEYVAKDAFNNCEELSIYIPVKTKPLGWDKNWYGEDVNVVWGGRNRTFETETLTLSNYTFPSSYNDFNPISETINTQSGKSVITNRLRCGVIEHDNKSYLTLSAKNRNATQAYIEYYFHEYIVEIDYQLALWSSSESLINNSSIRLEILYNNEWIVVTEFSAKELSQNKDELLDYNIELQIPSKGIRFIVDTNQVYNDNNRGRLVIGDIDVTMVHNYYYIATKYDNEKHYLECDCGDSCYGSHLVTEKHENNGHVYGDCDICGGFVDLDTGIIPDIKTYSLFGTRSVIQCDIEMLIYKEEYKEESI